MTSTMTPPEEAGAAAAPLTVSAAAEAVAAGTLRAVDLLRQVTAVADAVDSRVGIYLQRTDEQAMAAAEAVDAAVAAGDPVGPLAGVPLGIKDIISMAGTTTTAQSLILDASFGEQGDAPVVARLRAAGAVCTGKVTTMEYAIGLPDDEKPFPVPRNPWDLDTWPGGSSSGTGSGIIAGAFLGGLGTDTGGSVRLPACWSGISGLKQTFGRVPKSGCVPLGYSYDNIGPMARSARDCALMLQVMAGHDESDACSVDVPVDDYVGALSRGLEGLRLGVDFSTLGSPGADPENGQLFQAAVDALVAAGAVVSEVVLPYQAEAKTATMAGLTAEAFAYHRADLQQRWTDYGRETRMAIALGAMSTASDYTQAQRVRRSIIRELAPLFDRVDVVLNPTCLVAAPLIKGLDFGDLIDSINTPYWNATGNPAISVPMGITSRGLPVGLQIAGRPFEESVVLRVADAYQQVTDHHLAVAPAIV